ncbi:MAG TPA: sugar ABC transporter permease [Trueperaceae bacterium]|nr:sugar ABC transporter permease [Trueperaceae bacterium]
MNAPAQSRRRVSRRTWGEWLTGYAFVAPAAVIIGIFGLFPIVYALYMSVYSWRVRKGAFIGLENYLRTVGDVRGAIAFFGGLLLVLVAHWLWTDAFRGGHEGARRALRAAGALVLLGAGVSVALGWRLMTLRGDRAFLQGLVRTVYYGFGSVPIQIALALVLASLLFQKIRGREFFRMLFFLPYVTPAVAGAAVFRAIFSPRRDFLANTVLSWLHIPPQRWLFETKPVTEILFGGLLAHLGVHGPFTGFWAGPSLALVTIILFGIWTYVGYNAVIFLAGLGNIPRELYEAAAIDGADGVQQFRHITVPLLSPVTFYLTVLGFIGTFQAFTQIYVMRQVAVRDAVDTASVVIFDTFYKRNDWSLAAAQSVVLFAIILILTLCQSRFYGRTALRG